MRPRLDKQWWWIRSLSLHHQKHTKLCILMWAENVISHPHVRKLLIAPERKIAYIPTCSPQKWADLAIWGYQITNEETIFSNCLSRFDLRALKPTTGSQVHKHIRTHIKHKQTENRRTHSTIKIFVINMWLVINRLIHRLLHWNFPALCLAFRSI